jgi:hypothetical protein
LPAGMLVFPGGVPNSVAPLVKTRLPQVTKPQVTYSPAGHRVVILCISATIRGRMEPVRFK